MIPMNLNVEQILKENHLSITTGRKIILNLFLQSECALIHNDIEKKCTGIVDRMGIYRTLQSFLKRNIIHSIPTADDTIKYALSKVHFNKENNSLSHVHFICSKCNKTLCLDAANMPQIKLPDGFKMKDCQILLKGICIHCK